MLSEECNGGIWPAGIRARDGRLWLPTQDGVAVIDPRAVAANTRPPTVRIESTVVDGTPVADDRAIQLVPGHENLEIRYTGLTFINAERMVFRYRLHGVDRDWVYAGTRRFVHYAHIPSGRYAFSVLAANSDGVWADAPATVDVVVLPPYWQTGSFRGSVGLGVILAGGGRVSTARCRTATRHRTTAGLRPPADRCAGGGAATHRDRAARRAWTEPPHHEESRSARRRRRPQSDVESAAEQLDEIAATAGDAIDEVRQIAYNLRPYHLDRLGLRQAIEEMVARVEASSSIAIDVDVAALDGSVASDAAINCYRIVQECLSNVVRHARATTATIDAAVEGQEVRLTIADNGTGFDRAGSLCRPSDRGARHDRRRGTGDDAWRVAHRDVASWRGHDDHHPIPGERRTGAAPIMSGPLTIFIADDHPIFRQGLRQLLEREPGFSVLGDAGDGLSALEAHRTAPSEHRRPGHRHAGHGRARRRRRRPRAPPADRDRLPDDAQGCPVPERGIERRRHGIRAQGRGARSRSSTACSRSRPAGTTSARSSRATSSHGTRRRAPWRNRRPESKRSPKPSARCCACSPSSRRRRRSPTRSRSALGPSTGTVRTWPKSSDLNGTHALTKFAVTRGSAL